MDVSLNIYEEHKQGSDYRKGGFKTVRRVESFKRQT